MAEKEHINLNTADVKELEKIEGVGEARAKAIVQYRQEHGAFKNWDDFDKVPGFSHQLIEVVKRSGAVIQESKS